MFNGFQFQLYQSWKLKMYKKYGKLKMYNKCGNKTTNQFQMSISPLSRWSTRRQLLTIQQGFEYAEKIANISWKQKYL